MIQFLRGTQSQLQSSQQIFAAGQPIFESDTGQLKIGNGINNFAGLPYVGGSSSGQGVIGLKPVSYWNSYDEIYFDINDNVRFSMAWDHDNTSISSYTDSSSGGKYYYCSGGSTKRLFTSWKANIIGYFANVNVSSMFAYVASCYVNNNDVIVSFGSQLSLEELRDVGISFSVGVLTCDTISSN